MIKLAVILALVIFGWRWAFGTWPWAHLTSGQNGGPKGKLSHAQQVSRARRLLGVDAKADLQQIRDAHRKIASDIHPDRGGSDARLAEINTARDLLIEEAAKNEKDG
ncbi:J domain-containing protein [Erythrobacter sp. W53]|uniref:J domain-containing protein n=1 Tax=Erythrobacter sp. W53 TaxID=3425947 RepID=UPI003D76871A